MLIKCVLYYITNKYINSAYFITCVECLFLVVLHAGTNADIFVRQHEGVYRGLFMKMANIQNILFEDMLMFLELLN